MMLKETLKKIVKSQNEELFSFEYGVKRKKLDKIDLDVSLAIILSGIRRCGKSTLLRQIARELDNFYYFNFEDTRTVNFEVSDFNKLDQAFTEELGESNYYLLDEIQNVEKWELFVRSMLDKKKYFVITGSNASLLSKELGTRLTGRHLTYELFPFSFKEFLTFTNQKADIKSFEDYLYRGGFPEYLKIDKAEVLQELLNDIISRDIVIRHNLRSSKTIKEMALYYLTNVGKEFSYNNLRKTFSLGSTNSVISYTSYLEDSYLIFTISKFDYSLKKQLVNPKKVYSIDNGMSRENSVSFSKDKGRMLENLVFINLRKKYRNIFYYKEKGECDFVIKEKNKITKAIQVCYDLNEDNKDREFDGLMGALRKFKLDEGLVLTYDQDDEIKIGDKKIIVKPTWKWLLE